MKVMIIRSKVRNSPLDTSLSFNSFQVLVMWIRIAALTMELKNHEWYVGFLYKTTKVPLKWERIHFLKSSQNIIININL